MEDIAFLVLCLLTINNVSYKGSNDFFYDYIELKNTNPIKGIFVWMIILYHYIHYYSREKYKYIYEEILNDFGQKVVTMFLFYSGFGLYESIKKKGNKYVKTLLIKALILFIKTQLILLVFLLRNIIYKMKTTLKQYLLSVIFYESLGNSKWFALTIIVYYIYTYIAFIFIKNKKLFFLGIINISIICCLHGYFVYNYYYPGKKICADNTLSFILGFCYSFSKKYIDKIMMRNDSSYFGIFFIFIVTYYYLYIQPSSIFKSIYINGIFGIITVFVSMKIRFNNEFLNFLNSHSYSIYLLQKVVLSTFYNKKYLENYGFMKIFIQFTLILYIATTFDKYTTFIDKFFKRNNKICIKREIKNKTKEEKKMDGQTTIINFIQKK